MTLLGKPGRWWFYRWSRDVSLVLLGMNVVLGQWWVVAVCAVAAVSCGVVLDGFALEGEGLDGR